MAHFISDGDQLMDDKRFERQKAFILEADKLKNIFRQTYITDGSRMENDAEHSFHLALMVPLLAEYCDEELDILKAMKTAVIHDFVEIDAGDTYAYDYEAAKTKPEREKKAADRLFGLLPEDQEAEFRQLWEDFENLSTPEGRFVAALDRLQPVLLTDHEGGKSWREHKVKRTAAKDRNSYAYKGSRYLGDRLFELLDKNIENGNILDE